MGVFFLSVCVDGFVDFECLGDDGFVGVVEELYGRVVGGEDVVFRVFRFRGLFVHLIVSRCCGGWGVVPLFFEEFSFVGVVEYIEGFLGGGGVCDCFRFRGVFVCLYVDFFVDEDCWCLVV